MRLNWRALRFIALIFSACLSRSWAGRGEAHKLDTSCLLFWFLQNRTFWCCNPVGLRANVTVQGSNTWHVSLPRSELWCAASVSTKVLPKSVRRDRVERKVVEKSLYCSSFTVEMLSSSDKTAPQCSVSAAATVVYMLVAASCFCHN